MSTKRLGLLLIITPIIGFLGWFLSGGPTTPAGDMEGGYGAFAMEFVGKNTDQLHIAMGVAGPPDKNHPMKPSIGVIINNKPNLLVPIIYLLYWIN